MFVGFFMEAEVQTEVIYAALSEERKTGELVPLNKTFYTNAEESIKKAEKTSTPAELQNRIATLSALKAKRTQKILVYIAYGKTLPNQMPKEEESLYYTILKALNKEVTPSKTARIKILIKIPEIITNKGKRIGPYEQGEILQIEDPDDAEFLINNKIGEIQDQ